MSKKQFYPDTTITYPEGANLIPIADVVEGDRRRVNYGDLEDLKLSISENGLIQPIILTDNNLLVAGGRRFRAHQELGIGYIAYLRRSELSESEYRTIELEENEARQAMSWQERVVSIRDIHNLKMREDRKHNLSPRDVAVLEATGKTVWGQTQTGRLLGVSAAYVSQAIAVALCLDNKDPEILAAENYNTALNILSQRHEDKLSASRAGKATAQRKETSLTPTIPSSSSHSGPLYASSSGPIDLFLSGSGPETDAPAGPVKTFPLSDSFFLGKVEDLLPKLPDSFVDHIICDPPYAIDVSTFANKGADRVQATHKVPENLELLSWFCSAAGRVIKPGGHLLMWCDPMQFRFLHDKLKKAGFRVQRWPLIWHKLHPCVNKSATFNTTKNFEFVIKARKERATINTVYPSSIFACEGRTECEQYDNPFAKPFAAWKWLIEMVSTEGQTILDPFGGEFSSSRACINLNRNPIAFECEPLHYNKGVSDIKQHLTTINNGKIQFV